MKYLNRQNKETLVLLSCVQVALQEVIQSWNNKIDTQIIKRIKTANTNLENSVKMIVEGIDKTQYEAIKRSINYLKLTVTHTDDIKKQFAEEKEMIENKLVKNNILDDLLELSMNNCIGCKKDASGCKINKLYRELDAPVYDENSDCPWRIDT